MNLTFVPDDLESPRAGDLDPGRHGDTSGDGYGCRLLGPPRVRRLGQYSPGEEEMNKNYLFISCHNCIVIILFNKPNHNQKQRSKPCWYKEQFQSF